MDLRIPPAPTHTPPIRPSPRPCHLQQTLEIETREWKGSKRLNHEPRHLIRLKTRSAYDPFPSSQKHHGGNSVLKALDDIHAITMTHSCYSTSYGGLLHGPARFAADHELKLLASFTAFFCVHHEASHICVSFCIHMQSFQLLRPFHRTDRPCIPTRSPQTLRCQKQPT